MEPTLSGKSRKVRARKLLTDNKGKTVNCEGTMGFVCGVDIEDSELIIKVAEDSNGGLVII